MMRDYTEAERAALIADCKDEIVGIKQKLAECGDDGYAQMYLQSKLHRQEIALAALTAKPVKLAKDLKLSEKAHQSHCDYAEGYNDRAEMDRSAIRAAGYEVIE